MYENTSHYAGGGGAGGGALVLIAPKVTISGTIDASGGAGGNGTGDGGDGSGGGIWIRAASVDVSGTIDIGTGILRIDAHEINYSGDYIPGDLTGVPNLLQIERDSSGGITLKNNSHNVQNVVFSIIE